MTNARLAKCDSLTRYGTLRSVDHSMQLWLLQYGGNAVLWWLQHCKFTYERCIKPSVDDLYTKRGTVLERVGLSYDLLRFCLQLLDDEFISQQPPPIQLVPREGVFGTSGVEFVDSCLALVRLELIGLVSAIPDIRVINLGSWCLASRSSNDKLSWVLRLIG